MIYDNMLSRIKTLTVGTITKLNCLEHLQPVHRVGVSVKVIWVMSQGPYGEHVHLFQIFAILKYVVKLIMKPIIFSLVARQLALTWQAVCTEIVVHGLICYHPSMKRIQSPSTELWHILAVYIMSQCDLHLSPIFSKIGSHDREVVMNIYTYIEIHRLFCY